MRPLLLKALSVLSVLSLCNCQCLRPVDEEAAGDAGNPVAVPLDAGGRDGGSDIGQLCRRAADCAGAAAVVSWCSTVLHVDSGFSCIDGRCVAQCANRVGQTCVVDPAVGCLQCPPTVSCIPPSCGGGYEQVFKVEELACSGPAPLRVGDKIRETPADGGCGIPLFLQSDGGEALFGYIFLQSLRELSAHIDALGGTCLVDELPTSAPRLLLDCPRCQVALGP